MYEKVKSPSYVTQIQQAYDAVEGYYYFVEISDEMLEELGWSENIELNAEVRLAIKGNVIVISRR